MSKKTLLEQFKEKKWTSIILNYNIWVIVDKETIIKEIEQSGHKLEDIIDIYDHSWEIHFCFNDDAEIVIEANLPNETDYSQAESIEVYKAK